MPTTLLGTVSNPYSNFLSILAVDATHAAAWTGSDGEDFERAVDLTERGTHDISIGPGAGVICEVGGCGVSEIYRVNDRTLVFVEHYTGDEDDEIERDFIDKLTSLPTAESCERLGAVAVDSGALALVALIEPVGELSGSDIDAVAKEAGAGRTFEWGTLASLPAGRYEIWREHLGEIRGEWGLIVSRLRVVAEGTPVVPGQPIVAPGKKTQKKARRSKRPDSRRLIVEAWDSVKSFAVASDGSRYFAGEKGGFGVCCWDEQGQVVWERRLYQGAHYSHEVIIDLTPDGAILACPPYDGSLIELDPANGERLKKHEIASLRAFGLSPDGRLIALRVSTKTRLCSYPSMAIVAELGEYCNQNTVAISPDGRWLAVNGHQVHVYALPAARHATTFEPPQSPWASCFSPATNHLALGGSDGMVRIHEPDGWSCVRELDVAVERKRKPTVTALAYDAAGRQLAAARDDGTVRVWDTDSWALLHSLDKHDASIPGTGARSLSKVAFIDDGGQLVVSAAPKKQPTGLTVYRL
jgi:hypothetical protein